MGTRSATSLSSATDGSESAAAGASGSTSTSISSSASRPRARSSAHRHEPYRLPPNRLGASTGSGRQIPFSAGAATLPGPSYQYADYTSGPAFHPPAPQVPKINTTLANTHGQSRHGRHSSWQTTLTPDKVSFSPQQSSFNDITPTLPSAPTMAGPDEHPSQQQHVKGRPWSSPTDPSQQYPQFRSFPVSSGSSPYFSHSYPFQYTTDYPRHPSSSLHPDQSPLTNTMSPSMPQHGQGIAVYSAA